MHGCNYETAKPNTKSCIKIKESEIYPAILNHFIVMMQISMSANTVSLTLQHKWLSVQL